MPTIEHISQCSSSKSFKRFFERLKPLITASMLEGGDPGRLTPWSRILSLERDVMLTTRFSEGKPGVLRKWI